jgi:hypothetical protein
MPSLFRDVEEKCENRAKLYQKMSDNTPGDIKIQAVLGPLF